MIDWLSRFEPSTLLVAFIVLGTLAAFPLMAAALGRLAGLRLASGSLCLLLGALVFLIGLSSALAAASLHGYRRIAQEETAANVSIRHLGERQFALSIEVPGSSAPWDYELQGDEWQIDARLLRWDGLREIIGFDSIYRLHRLSARYAEPGAGQGAAQVAHALPRKEPVDFWALLRRYGAYLPFVDTYYGPAEYVPLGEGARYVVMVSRSGLAVRPYVPPGERHRLDALH
jgi:hypothetical protein